MTFFYLWQPEPEPEPEPEEGPTDFYENVEMPDTQPDSTYDMPEEQLQEEQPSYETVSSEAEQPAEPAGYGDDLYDNMGMDAAPAQVLVIHVPVDYERGRGGGGVL